MEEHNEGLTVLFVKEDRLLTQHGHNGYEAFVQAWQDALSFARVGEEELAGFLAQNAADPLVLVSSRQKDLDVAQEYGTAHVGFEDTQRLSASQIVLSWDALSPSYLYKVYARAHGLPVTVLRTEHCILREITLEDLDDLYTIYADPRITRFMEPLYADRKQEEDYTRAYIENIYGFYDFGMWIVEDHRSRRRGYARHRRGKRAGAWLYDRRAVPGTRPGAGGLPRGPCLCMGKYGL